MKKVILKASIFIFAIALSCSHTMTLKKKPQGDNWQLCPSCRGYGELEVIKDSSIDSNIREDSNTKEKSVAAGCFSLPFSPNTGNKLSSQYNSEKDAREQKNYDQGNVYTTEIIDCPRCSGKGWIKDALKSESNDKFIEDDTSQYNDKKLREIKKQINKSKKK